ncbi:MAG: prolipoprotein diacylglyceryl transferase [Chloroflexi bacterium]|nr:prolipoprotein diacylglyceryl transferase [Chloroflexota bacterium]
MIEISINPIIFSIGSFNLGWYGLWIGVGVTALLAWVIYSTIKYKPGFNIENIMTVAIVAIPSALIGARLFHVIDYWDYYVAHLNEIIGFEGLAIWGALIFGVGAVFVYCQFAKVNFFKIADTAIPGLFLAQAIGRLGCLFTGCCYGNVTNVSWSISYTNSASHGYYDSQFLDAGTGFHPTQIYESLFMLAMFFLFAFVLRRQRWPVGTLFIGYIAAYSLWRIVLGFFRINESVLWVFSQAQLIGIVGLLIVAPLMWWYISRSEQQQNQNQKENNQKIE